MWLCKFSLRERVSATARDRRRRSVRVVRGRGCAARAEAAAGSASRVADGDPTCLSTGRPRVGRGKTSGRSATAAVPRRHSVVGPERICRSSTQRRDRRGRAGPDVARNASHFFQQPSCAGRAADHRPPRTASRSSGEWPDARRLSCGRGSVATASGRASGPRHRCRCVCGRGSSTSLVLPVGRGSRSRARRPTVSRAVAGTARVVWLPGRRAAAGRCPSTSFDACLSDSGPYAMRVRGRPGGFDV